MLRVSFTADAVAPPAGPWEQCSSAGTDEHALWFQTYSSGAHRDKNGPHQRSLHALFIPKSVNKICILNFSGLFHPPLKHTVLLLSLSVTKTDFIWSRRVKPHSPWYEKRPLWSPSLPVFLPDCECVTNSVCPLVHRIKSNPADGHVLLNQHSDKWKTVNLNGLVKLASVLIAYQASGSSSCHGGEKKWTSLPKCWKQAGCLVP